MHPCSLETWTSARNIVLLSGGQARFLHLGMSVCCSNTVWEQSLYVFMLAYMYLQTYTLTWECNQSQDRGN